MASIIASVAALVAALAAAYTSMVNGRHLREVRHEVKTSNGITIAALADLQEGRRIKADIPESERTHSEQEYVLKLGDGK